ncbi:hypothetical protein ACFQU7_04740 [Pseudoroseomonas wenyumeiae]
MLTLAGLIILGVGSLAFGLNVGMVAITIAVVLALLSPNAQKGAIDKVSWSTVLLIAGVITYVGVLQKSGPSTASPTAWPGWARRCWRRCCSATSAASSRPSLPPPACWGPSSRWPCPSWPGARSAWRA